MGLGVSQIISTSRQKAKSDKFMNNTEPPSNLAEELRALSTKEIDPAIIQAIEVDLRNNAQKRFKQCHIKATKYSFGEVDAILSHFRKEGLEVRYECGRPGGDEGYLTFSW